VLANGLTSVVLGVYGRSKVMASLGRIPAQNDEIPVTMCNSRLGVLLVT
jgi:hypothetical protein